MALQIGQKANKKEQSFDDALVTQALIDPNNDTIYRLERDSMMRRALIKNLKDIQQTKFINLVTEIDQAHIAMALYAGDGVVTKITPCNYMATEQFPYVVPPFSSHVVEYGDELDRRFAVENYPYLSTRGINQQCVEEMKETLAKIGVRFKKGDARPENLARLKDGTLAVIDGDALELIDFTNPREMRKHVAPWMEKIHAMYPTLYAPGFKYSQSPNTDFTIRPIEEPAEVNKKPKSWFQFLTHSSSSERQI